MIEHDIQADFCNLLYKNLEMQTIHPPYEQELRELHCIENGDLELLEKTIPQSYDDSYNAILAKNPIRHIICQAYDMVYHLLIMRFNFPFNISFV